MQLDISKQIKVSLTKLRGFSRYYIASNGAIISIRKNGQIRFVKSGIQPNGYMRAWLRDDCNEWHFLWLHRIVWSAFNLGRIEGIAKGYEVAHLDDNKQNNNLENLLLCTHKENCNMGMRNKKISMALKGKKRNRKEKKQDVNR